MKPTRLSSIKTYALGLALALGAFTASNASASVVKDGFTLPFCQIAELYDYYDVNGEYGQEELEYDYCKPSAVKQYKKFLTHKPNFNKEYVLIVLDKKYFVAIHPKTKEVYPFHMTVWNYETQTVAKVEFSLKKNSICTIEGGAGMHPILPIFSGTSGGADVMPNTRLCAYFNNSKNKAEKGFEHGAWVDLKDRRTGKSLNHKTGKPLN